MSLRHQVESLVYLDNSIQLSPYSSLTCAQQGVTGRTQWLEPLTNQSIPKGQCRLSSLISTESLSGDKGPLTLIDNGRGKGKGKGKGKGNHTAMSVVNMAYQSCLFTDHLTLNFQCPTSVELLMNQVHFTNI